MAESSLEEEEEKMSMIVRFWGVRGSVPAPGPDTAGVGGNTSCVQLQLGDEQLILDAGTGLRALGAHLLKEAQGRPIDATILFSHVHWDHIQGIPFFAPLFNPQTKLGLYGQPEQGSLRDALVKQMTYPTFPVTFDQLPSRLTFGNIPAIGRRFGSFAVRRADLNHPNGVAAYRVEAAGRAVVFATDTEHYEDGRIDEALVELARDADVLIYDAQFTPDEYEGRVGMSRKGWGHSTWAEGVRVADAANVKQLVLFHHDPSHDDAQVAEIEHAAQQLRPGTIAAREGLELVLDTKWAQKAA